MNNRPTREDQLIKSYLQRSSLKDLILAYIEANTDTKEDIDRVPLTFLLSLDQLEKEVVRMYGDRLIKKALANEDKGK